MNELLDNLDYGILELDKNYKILYANKYAKINMNLKNLDENIIGVYDNLIHIEDIDNEKKLCNNFFNKLEDSESVCRIYIETKYKWYKIKRKKSDKNPTTFIISFENIDDLKSMEIDLLKAKEESLLNEKHKNLYFANVNHELRTPINGIMGMVTLIEDTVLNNYQREYVDMLKECSVNLMSIINDILDFSKLEAGKITLDNKCFNLKECIGSVNDILLSKIYEKNLEYNFYISENVPDFIECDCHRLKQILLNILNNSIKFTDKGSIILRINKQENKTYEMYEDIYLKFSIEDTGCGIDKSNISKLFKSFSQIENSDKLNQGTGLGLAISKELVLLMHGDIFVEKTEIGCGSTFSFTIKTKQCNKNLITNNDSNYDILFGRKVFILDDKYENRLSLASQITKWGMIPTPYSSAKEALYFLQTSNFELGLVDICMPEINGKEFSNRLKEQCELLNKNQIPLIALSSLGENFKDYKNFKSHLIKPIKESKLKQICINILTNSSVLNNNNNITNTNNTNNKIKNSLRILLVEDIPINQRVIISFLNKLGYNQVDVSENGKICLEMLSKKKYDIILLDIRMPIINGETVFKYINNYYNNISSNLISDNYILMNRDKPYIVAVTAYSLREDREKYLNMGFDDFISKPIGIKALNDCMENFIKIILKK